MTHQAFEFSEQFGIPVLMRITTRLAHSRSIISLAEVKKQNKLTLPSDPKQFVLLPSIAKVRYKGLINKQVAMQIASDESEFNSYR